MILSVIDVPAHACSIGGCELSAVTARIAPNRTAGAACLLPVLLLHAGREVAFFFSLEWVSSAQTIISIGRGHSRAIRATVH